MIALDGVIFGMIVVFLTALYFALFYSFKDINHKNIWHPISYRNYNDTSYRKDISKPGAPSYLIDYVCLKTSKHKQEIFYGAGYFDDERFDNLVKIFEHRNSQYLPQKW